MRLRDLLYGPLTGWFTFGTKPARKGPYLTRLAGELTPGFRAWDGRHWGGRSETADGAVIELHITGPVWARHDIEWRGLSTDPKGKK